MRRLAIIPARGGSKRIPNKNIRDFCGRPMIAHVLETAHLSELFSVIHVSTENENICEVVTKIGFPPAFRRPKLLAEDHTPIMPVLRHTLEQFTNRGEVFDEVWLLMACAPLIGVKDLQTAAQRFRDAGGDRPLLAVSEYPAPVEWAFRLDCNGELIPLHPGMFATRSQDLEKRYFDSGSFAIFSAQGIFGSCKLGSDQGFIGFVLPKGSNVDIDDEEDWALAETIFRARKESDRKPQIST